MITFLFVDNFGEYYEKQKFKNKRNTDQRSDQ